MMKRLISVPRLREWKGISRLREGALSPLSTPTVPPAQARLVPLKETTPCDTPKSLAAVFAGVTFSGKHV